MKTILAVAVASTLGLFASAAQAAPNACAPSASVICSIGYSNYDVSPSVQTGTLVYGHYLIVSTTFQGVKGFAFNPDSPQHEPTSLASVEAEANAFANQLKNAGVCAVVVDNIHP